jgi:hypothetical protein
VKYVKKILFANHQHLCVMDPPPTISHNTSRLTISLPQASPLALELMSENENEPDPATNDGSNTAPIFVGTQDAQRPRHFSVGE